MCVWCRVRLKNTHWTDVIGHMGQHLLTGGSAVYFNNGYEEHSVTA